MAFFKKFAKVKLGRHNIVKLMSAGMINDFK